MEIHCRGQKSSYAYQHLPPTSIEHTFLFNSVLLMRLSNIYIYISLNKYYFYMVNTYSLLSLPCHWSKRWPHCCLHVGNGNRVKKEWADTLNGPMNLSLSLPLSLSRRTSFPHDLKAPNPFGFPATHPHLESLLSFGVSLTPLHSTPPHSTQRTNPSSPSRSSKRSKLSVQTLTHFSRRSRRMTRMRRAKP